MTNDDGRLKKQTRKNSNSTATMMVLKLQKDNTSKPRGVVRGRGFKTMTGYCGVNSFVSN